MLGACNNGGSSTAGANHTARVAALLPTSAPSSPVQPSGLTTMPDACDSNNITLARTHTWSLDANNNSKCYPLFSDLNYDSSNTNTINLPTSSTNGLYYVAPSSTSLTASSNFQNVTLSGTAAASSGGIDFTAINRTRPDTAIYMTDSSGNPYPVTFQGWGLIKNFIAFGGGDAAGSHIIAPDPAWVTAAHTEGVKIYGTVFLGAGSSWAEVNTLTQNAAKLTDLAHKLNLDGWLINMEYPYLDSVKSQLLNFYSQIFANTNNVSYIVYFSGSGGFPSTGQYNTSQWASINDSNIANFGQRSGGQTTLDLALGLEIEAATYDANGSKFIDGDPLSQTRSYLLYLDEPITRKVMEGYVYPVRAQAAMAVACQQFNGTSNPSWPGLKNRANVRVQTSSTLTPDQLQIAAQNRICVNAGSNVNDPISIVNPVPGPVLKITVPTGTTASIITNSASATTVNTAVNTTLQNCTSDNFNTPCYFDLLALKLTDNSTGTISFRVKIGSGIPSDTYKSQSGGQEQTINLTTPQDPTQIQTVPNAKWFNKLPGQARDAATFVSIWDYWSIVANNGAVQYVQGNTPLISKCQAVPNDSTICDVSIPYWSGSSSQVPPASFPVNQTIYNVGGKSYGVQKYVSQPAEAPNYFEWFSGETNTQNTIVTNLQNQANYANTPPAMSMFINGLIGAIQNSGYLNTAQYYASNYQLPGMYYIDASSQQLALPVPLWPSNQTSWPNNSTGNYKHDFTGGSTGIDYGNFPALDWVMNVPRWGLF